jgi:hypothetical protein
VVGVRFEHADELADAQAFGDDLRERPGSFEMDDALPAIRVSRGVPVGGDHAVARGNWTCGSNLGWPSADDLHPRASECSWRSPRDAHRAAAAAPVGKVALEMRAHDLRASRAPAGVSTNSCPRASINPGDCMRVTTVTMVEPRRPSAPAIDAREPGPAIPRRPVLEGVFELPPVSGGAPRPLPTQTSPKQEDQRGEHGNYEEILHF